MATLLIFLNNIININNMIKKITKNLLTFALYFRLMVKETVAYSAKNYKSQMLSFFTIDVMMMLLQLLVHRRIPFLFFLQDTFCMLCVQNAVMHLNASMTGYQRSFL